MVRARGIAGDPALSSDPPLPFTLIITISVGIGDNLGDPSSLCLASSSSVFAGFDRAGNFPS